MKYFIAHINQESEWIEEKECNRESLRPHIEALISEKKEGAEVAFFGTRVEAIKSCIDSINRRIELLVKQVDIDAARLIELKKELG